MMILRSFRGDVRSELQEQRIMDLICEGVWSVISAVVKSCR